jgi:hypothetical protein
MHIFKNKTLFFACGLLLFFVTASASDKLVETPYFSMQLPEEMTEVLVNLDEENQLYQYVYQAMPYGKESPQQVMVTIKTGLTNLGENAESLPSEYIGLKIAWLAETYDLYPELLKSSVVEQMNNGFANMLINGQAFTYAPVDVANMDAVFLTTIVNDSLYAITLLSISDDAAQRDAGAEMLANKVQTFSIIK